MIRVVLPQPLCMLARIDREVTVEVEGPVSQRAVLDALEAGYPVLRGTIRSRHATATGVSAVLRLRAGSVACGAGCAAAGGGG